MNPTPGRLYLVPAPLDFGTGTPMPVQDQLPRATLETAARLRHWVCENARSLRALLARIDAVHPLAQALQSLDIRELPRQVHKHGDHQGEFDATALLAPAQAGADIGLASEAGMPAIADPGSSVVRAAHALGIEVVPLVGPVSLVLALAASGLNGQDFAFVGYLPTDAEARARRIAALDALVHRSGQTQLCIETPYRNAALLQALLRHLRPATRLAVSAGLGTPQAHTTSATVAQWRARGTPAPDKHCPAVFAIGR